MHKAVLIQLFAMSIFTFIAFSVVGQVAELPLVRLDETNPVLLREEAALLERNLDDSYFQTTSEGKLYFRFLEKYVDATLDVSVYNWKREELLSTTVNVSKQYGENWYMLDGQALNLELNQYYFVEVKDENKQRSLLRFKYFFNAEEDPIRLILSCEESNPMLGCDQHIQLVNPTDAVTIDASIVEGNAPFKITWTLIKRDANRDILESLVVKEETSSELNYTYTEDLDTWQTPYEVKFKVVDACGNEKSCTFCVTSVNDERISSEKASKFFLFFNLKRNKKDKEKNENTPKNKDNKTN